MDKMKLDVLVACFAYGGNGAAPMLLPEVGFWLGKNLHVIKSDPRVGRVSVKQFGDTPLTMERNRVVRGAKEGGYDVIVMIDSDNAPDLYLKHSPNAKPFWDSSFDFLYERKLRGLPSVICAPYCGPPPHPTRGGEENVYVFYFQDTETDPRHGQFKLEAYSRKHAQQMTGIQEIGAGPTGLIMYSTDAFDLMPCHTYTTLEILQMFHSGEISADRAELLLRMDSWFFYEYTDGLQTQKASTEDVTNTREIQMAGMLAHGQPVVFCNWDAWAGHYKPKCVGKPSVATLGDISAHYAEAVENAAKAGAQIQGVDFTEGDHWPEHSQGGRSTPQAQEPQQQAPSHPVVGSSDRMIAGRRVTSIGFQTGLMDLDALRDMVSMLSQQAPEKHLRIIEIGSWVGESAISMQSGFGVGGGTVFCIDKFEGSDDYSGDVAESLGKQNVRKYFLKNTGDLFGNRIKLHEMDWREAASTLDPQDADLVFLDADHSYEETRDAIAAWLPHVHPTTGLLVGHDWHAEYPGVEKAVQEVCDAAGIKPRLIEDTRLWWFSAKEYHDGLQRHAQKAEAAHAEASV